MYGIAFPIPSKNFSYPPVNFLLALTLKIFAYPVNFLLALSPLLFQYRLPICFPLPAYRIAGHTSRALP